MPHNISDQEIDGLPKMTGWFEPGLLLQLLWRVVVADIFGQYADRRLIVAALDTQLPIVLEDRATADIADRIKPDRDGAIWIDYVSDLGDGFDATYAIAFLLAQERLAFDPATLSFDLQTTRSASANTAPAFKPKPDVTRRGSLLIMGGDQVYPTSTRDDYDRRLLRPYNLAFPFDPKDPKRPKRRPHVFLIPGNHDWYDGLVEFYALFCAERPTDLGAWRATQRRSYFALCLRTEPDWWIWGIDIQLTEDMDQPQEEYFTIIARRMPRGARIILCSAEPGWYGAEEKGAAFRTLHKAAEIADNARDRSGPKHFKIITVLSGDTHHYARYVSEPSAPSASDPAGTPAAPSDPMEAGTAVTSSDLTKEGTDALASDPANPAGTPVAPRPVLKAHFITAGGGGAYLNSTHNLHKRIAIDWLKESTSLLLKKRYPDPWRSRTLLLKNVFFPFLNPGFSALLGAIFALLGWLFLALHWPLWVKVTALLATFYVGFGSYSKYQEKRRFLTLAGLKRDRQRGTAGETVDDAIGKLRRWAWRARLGVAVHAAAQAFALVWLSRLLQQVEGSPRGHGPMCLAPTSEWTAKPAVACGTRWTDGIVPGAGQVMDVLPPLAFLGEMLLLGGFASGLLFGLYLMATCWFFDVNDNDAYSALRLDSHRHFLRLRIQGDKLTIYPIAVDEVPRRKEWLRNPKAEGHPEKSRRFWPADMDPSPFLETSPGSVLLPPRWFKPKLIEPAIVIDAAEVGSVSDAVKTETLHDVTPTPS